MTRPRRASELSLVSTRLCGVRDSRPGCRDPLRALAHEQWLPRTGLALTRAGKSSLQMRASSFSPAVPPACHKQQSRAVCSGQSRSLRDGRWAGRRSLTWGGGGGRNRMACRGSPARIDPAVPGWPRRRPPAMPRGWGRLPGGSRRGWRVPVPVRGPASTEGRPLVGHDGRAAKR